jgi:DNA-binding CsgD family transcriptional regulator
MAKAKASETLEALAKPPSPQQMVSLIGALGTDAFEDELLELQHSIAGVEHYSIYRVVGEVPEFLGGASVRGKHPARLTGADKRYRRTYAELIRALNETQDSARLVQDPIDSDEDPGLTAALLHYHIVDRIMLCGRVAGHLYAVTMMRSEEAGVFEQDALARLELSSDLIIAICAKHALLHWDRPRGVKIFESVDIIEGTIKDATWGLSVRELQVAARILFGISALGISIDLGLGEDTIATYRKRLYARLSIGSRHELMQKYLSLF